MNVNLKCRCINWSESKGCCLNHDVNRRERPRKGSIRDAIQANNADQRIKVLEASQKPKVK